MKLLAYLTGVGAKLFHRAQIDDAVEEELRSHIQHRADDLERSGLTRAAAERRARVEFGGRVRFKEECQEALGGNFLETLTQDARFSLRVLRKSPGFAIVAVLTLVLAIGANAVVFGVLNGLILRLARKAFTPSSTGKSVPFPRRIPTIWTCAIVTAASMAWQVSTWPRQEWTRGRIQPKPGSMK